MSIASSSTSRFRVISVYIGTAIGAGILALPYVVNRMGIVPGLLLLIFTGVLIGMTMHAYAVVISVVPGTRQFVGYVTRILGTPWRFVTAVFVLVGVGGSLVAYIIEVSRVLLTIFQPIFGGSIQLYAFLFWFGVSVVLVVGIGVVMRIETAIVYSFMLLLLVFIIASAPFTRFVTDTSTHLSYGPVAFGVMLFAYAAYPALPEMRHIFTRHRHRSIFIPTVIVAHVLVVLFYVVFTGVIVSVTHDATTPIAFIGLQSVIGQWIFWPASLFTILALGSSAIVNSVSLHHTLQYDFRLPKFFSLFCTIVVPLLIAVVYQPSFVTVLSISGALSVGAIFIIIWFMYIRLYRHQQLPPTHHRYPIIVASICVMLFTLGTVFAIFFAV